MTIERSTISDNGGEYAGGVTVIGDVRVTDSVFIGNTPLDRPEILGVTGSLVIENSSFIDNGATGGGGPGGLIDIDGDFQIVNATFAGNAAGQSFAGEPAATILVRGGSTGSIVNSTLTGSREELSYGAGPDNAPAPGLYVAPTSQVTIANSIIDDSVVGTITSNGANTFRDPAVDGAVAGDQLGVTADELFALTEEIGNSGVLAGVAADNGGPTPTVALLRSASNPALDAADPADAPPSDQRGLPRDATPDIGSFELEVQPPPDTLPPLAEKVPLPDSEIVGAPLFLVGPSGDAEISFVDEYAAFQSSLGVYLVGPDGTIGATEWVFDRIEHSEASDEASANARPGGGPLTPGDAVLLSDLFAPEELTPGTGFGLFLAADGWTLNDAAIFEGGR